MLTNGHRLSGVVFPMAACAAGVGLFWASVRIYQFGRSVAMWTHEGSDTLGAPMSEPVATWTLVPQPLQLLDDNRATKGTVIETQELLVAERRVETQEQPTLAAVAVAAAAPGLSALAPPPIFVHAPAPSPSLLPLPPALLPSSTPAYHERPSSEPRVCPAAIARYREDYPNIKLRNVLKYFREHGASAGHTWHSELCIS